MKTIFLCVILLVMGWNRLLASENQPEYFSSFNPTNGFKPAQRDLTEVFLQIAGSLQYHGSPEPYLRHVKNEQERIAAKYRKLSGHEMRDFCPAYVTEGYIDRVGKSWDSLPASLELRPFTKKLGQLMRLSIKGTRDTGTIVVEILNEHQTRVLDSMKRAGEDSMVFDLLKSNLVARLELGKTNVNEEAYEISRRDAVSFVLVMEGITVRFHDKLDGTLPQREAEQAKAMLNAAFIDVGRMAQSELELGIFERAIDKKFANK